MKKKLALCAMFLLATSALVSTKISAMEQVTPDTRIINTNNNNNALEENKTQLMPEEICNINKFIENIKIDAKNIHKLFISNITTFDEFAFKDKNRCAYISHIINGYPESYKAAIEELKRELDALDYKIDKKDYDNYKVTFEKIFDSIDNFRKNLKIPTEQPNFKNDIITMSNKICEGINVIPKITISKIPETQQAAPILMPNIESQNQNNNIIYKNLQPNSKIVNSENDDQFKKLEELETKIELIKKELRSIDNYSYTKKLKNFLEKSTTFLKNFEIKLNNSKSIFNSISYQDIQKAIRLAWSAVDQSNDFNFFNTNPIELDDYDENNYDKNALHNDVFNIMTRINHNNSNEKELQGNIYDFIAQINKISQIIIKTKNNVPPPSSSYQQMKKEQKRK